MEYVEGQELRELVDRRKPVDPMRVMQISQKVLSALIEAHEIGIIHRDLKPADIMVLRLVVRASQVLDFGIASLGRVWERPLSMVVTSGDSRLRTRTVAGKPVGPADLSSLQ